MVCSHGQSLEEPGKGVSLNGQVGFGRVGIACFNSYNPIQIIRVNRAAYSVISSLKPLCFNNSRAYFFQSSNAVHEGY